MPIDFFRLENVILMFRWKQNKQKNSQKKFENINDRNYTSQIIYY